MLTVVLIISISLAYGQCQLSRREEEEDVIPHPVTAILLETMLLRSSGQHSWVASVKMIPG